jgi:hypothetical protein
MSKRTANHKTGLKVATKKKCSFKFKPEWLRELVETELPTASRKQLLKLGDIFIYRESSDNIVCQICPEACTGGEFNTGKRWNDWKIDVRNSKLRQTFSEEQ